MEKSRSFYPLSVDEVVKHFSLQPHPEGGFYREYYRSKGVINLENLPNSFKGDRNYCTAIFYLLPKGSQSKLHRIASDEIWHFHWGGSMTVVQISPEGSLEEIRLGSDIGHGEQLHHVVPAGYWFGAYPNEGTTYSLVCCTVAPGFDFQDFELADRKTLVQNFPQHRTLIEQLGHSMLNA